MLVVLGETTIRWEVWSNAESVRRWNGDISLSLLHSLSHHQAFRRIGCMANTTVVSCKCILGEYMATATSLITNRTCPQNATSDLNYVFR
jgi:hypothetical protein